jgi:hypothetical protein
MVRGERAGAKERVGETAYRRTPNAYFRTARNNVELRLLHR